jgi:hypothetical protein
MYKQVLDPVSHSLGLTAIFAVLFVLLGGVRMKAQNALMTIHMIGKKPNAAPSRPASSVCPNGIP